MYAHQTLLINSIPAKFAISNIIGKKLPLEWIKPLKLTKYDFLYFKPLKLIVISCSKMIWISTCLNQI